MCRTAWTGQADAYLVPRFPRGGGPEATPSLPAPMAPFTELRTRDDADAMLAASHLQPVVLLKHSTLCVASARGRSEVARLAETDGPPLYAVVVQHARAVSDYLAEHLGVRHETPQALVLHDGAVVLCQNHHAIAADLLLHATRLHA